MTKNHEFVREMSHHRYFFLATRAATNIADGPSEARKTAAIKALRELEKISDDAEGYGFRLYDIEVNNGNYDARMARRCLEVMAERKILI
jgi:hypothetical protein